MNALEQRLGFFHGVGHQCSFYAQDVTHDVPGVKVGFFVCSREPLTQLAHALQEAIAEGEKGVGQFDLIAREPLCVDVPAVSEHRLVEPGRLAGTKQGRNAASGRRWIAAHDQVADGGVNQAHLEHLRHARTAVTQQPAVHHDGKHHGSGLANAVFGMRLQLARDVQHLRQVRWQVALGQAATKKQGARQRAIFEEQLFGAGDLGGVHPGGHRFSLLQIALECLYDLRVVLGPIGLPLAQGGVGGPAGHQAGGHSHPARVQRGARGNQCGHGVVGQGVGAVHQAFKVVALGHVQPPWVCPLGLLFPMPPAHRGDQQGYAHGKEGNGPDFNRVPEGQLKQQGTAVDAQGHQRGQLL